MKEHRATSWSRKFSRYALELVIVFVGVWLSLLAENWRESRADASAQRASLSRMAEDLTLDLEDLRLNIVRAQFGIEAGRRLLTQDLGAASADSIPRDLTALQFYSGFIENQAEYLALRNSGRLGIISDADLRQRIVGSYERRNFLHALHADDRVHSETVAHLMRPFVILREPPEVRDVGAQSSDGFPDTANPRVSEVLDVTGLLTNIEFRNAVTALVSRRSFLLREIEARVAEAEALRNELLDRVGSR